MSSEYASADVENPVNDGQPTFDEAFDWGIFGLPDGDHALDAAEDDPGPADKWAAAKGADRMIGTGVSLAKHVSKSAISNMRRAPRRARKKAPARAPKVANHGFSLPPDPYEIELSKRVQRKLHNMRLMAETSREFMNLTTPAHKLGQRVQERLATTGHAAKPNTQMLVYRIGLYGWDESPEGQGIYENEVELVRLFSTFGEVVDATVQHVVDKGINTSWALVTMDEPLSVDRIVSTMVMAGDEQLRIVRFEPDLVEKEHRKREHKAIAKEVESRQALNCGFFQMTKKPIIATYIMYCCCVFGLLIFAAVNTGENSYAVYELNG
eukprot:COSAG01_NODE_11842_length_1848_cov_8.038308_2_plen_324_part_00